MDIEGLEDVIGKVIKKHRRTTEQNSRMWAMLSDISDQVEWHGEKMTKGDWK